MKYWKQNINYRQEKHIGQESRYFITVNGEDIEVDKSIYQVYTQMERRERYLLEREKNISLSLEQMYDDNLKLEFLTNNMIKSAEDTAILHENARETDQLLKKLPEAINQLNNEEQALIRALYIDGISIREYARMHGVYHRSIAYRRDKILKKLLDILQSEH